MKKIKKILSMSLLGASFVLAASIAVPLTSCSSNKEAINDKTDKPTVTPEPTPPNSMEEVDKDDKDKESDKDSDKDSNNTNGDSMDSSTNDATKPSTSINNLKLNLENDSISHKLGSSLKLLATGFDTKNNLNFYVKEPNSNEWKLIDSNKESCTYTPTNIGNYNFKVSMGGGNDSNVLDVNVVSNNPETFDYGTIPLAKKPTNELTHEDYMDMFNKIANVKYIGDYSFGDRNIKSNDIANEYIKWLVTRWIDYPYLASDQSTITFTNNVFNYSDDNDEFINKEADKHFVTNLSSYRYNYRWIRDPIYKDNFKFLVYTMLSQIDEKMTDLEKLYTVTKFVTNWYNYVLNFGPTNDENVFKHIGVCGDYASLQSLLLNIIGVPAIPMVTGIDSKNPNPHQVSWVYLDPNGGNNKKWWMSDATWCDDSGGNTYSPQTNGLSSTSTNKQNYQWLLRPTAKNQFESYDKGTSQHYNSNRYFEALWNEPYKENSTIGKATTSDAGDKFDIDKTCLNFDGKFEYVSNPSYIDGYWYFIGRSLYKPITTRLYKTKFLNGKLEEIKLPDNIRINSSRLMYHTYSYNGYLAFIDNGFEGNPDHPNQIDTNKNIVLFDVKDNKIVKEFEIQNSKYKSIKNFYILDDRIYYTFDFNKYEVIDMKLESKSTKYDYWKLVRYCRSVLGTYTTGDDYLQISSIDKNNFLNYLKKEDNRLLANKNLSEDWSQKINVLKGYLADIEKLAKWMPIGLTKIINSVYYLKDNDSLNLTSNFHSFTNVKDILSPPSLSFKYDLLVLNGKDKYEEIMTNQDALIVNRTNLSKYLNGNYRFRIRAHLEMDGKNEYLSNPFEIKLNSKEKYPELGELVSNNSHSGLGYYTNVDTSRLDSLNENVRLVSNISNCEKVSKVELLYNNLDKNDRKVVDITHLVKNGKIDLDVGKIDNHNHGVYMLKVSYKEGNEMHSLNSNFYFAFTKDDYLNYNHSKVINSIRLLVPEYTWDKEKINNK